MNTVTDTRLTDVTASSGRASALQPLLRDQAHEADASRRLPAPVVEAMVGAELHRLKVPAWLGGLESDNRATCDAVRAVARGDGSAGWTLAVWSISAWMTGLFPDAVQRGIQERPDARVSGILAPGGVVTPEGGDFLLSGRWPFNTGVTQSHWNTLAAVLQDGPDGPAPVMVLVPVDDLQVVDDWHTSGMRGSGSVTVLADAVRVPGAHVLPLGPALAGVPPQNRNLDLDLFRTPFMVMAGLTVGAVAVGLAEAAMDAFLERLPGRGITYTDHADQSRAGITHLQVGAAARLVEEARLHVAHAASTTDAKVARQEAWTVEERTRMRLHLGAATRRAREACDLLASASGGTSTHLDVPIQRIQRDMHTLALHAVMNPDVNDELYGRVAVGLEPHTPYI